MPSTIRHVVVLVTAPNRRTARRLAHVALQNRLVACANLVPGLESHYWWQGKIAQSPEILILFKTRRELIAALEKIILANHPYDTPEFVVLPINAGTKRYLKWIDDSVASSRSRRG